MKILHKTLTWTCTGCAAALIAGAPAIADDTELLLLSPNAAQNPKPNVMFILDTSGSMTDPQTTTEPYDATVTYSGSCQTDAMYWTDVDVLPSCDPANLQWIHKWAFQCDFAVRQIEGIGAFTNTMVQFRDSLPGDDTDEGNDRWDYLEPGNHTAPVECLSDSGLHGNGDVNVVYASSQTGVAWTQDPDEEVAWGSAPRNLSYTVYDGNYLNWKANPVTVTMSRTDIMKAVTKTVLNSVNNMNVGIMRFNNVQGGSVVTAVTDLDTNRTDVLNTITNLPADGWTPLSETLYESALYWTGGSMDFGDAAITDSGALAVATVGGEIYDQPTLGSCAKNYNVMISDGLPTEDEDGATRAPTLPDWSTVLGRSGCNGAVGQGYCLDDVAEYLSKVDTDANVDGVQNVTTHTIGFTQNIPILEDTAQAAGGKYFRADNIEQLTVALLQIVGEINDRALSFSAPAVSVNTFNRTRNLNNVYLTMFGARNQAHWPGNLKKYEISGNKIVDADGLDAVDPATGFFFDTARSIWTVGGDDGQDVELGGAARQLPLPASRNLYTNNGTDSTLSGNSNHLSTGNSAAYTLADFGLTGATGEPTKDQIIDWMRGVDVRDEDGNPATTVRYAMGDPLHSRPSAVVYGGTAANPDTVVFTATNDGYIHAVNGETGEELWSFVPKELLPNMARLYFNPSAKYKQYGVDGDLVTVTKDVDGDGVIEPGDNDFVRLIVGMRRGGTTYYGLDVTNKSAPELMWTKTLDFAGQSWSTPVVTRINMNVAGLNSDKGVVIVGGGYDPVHDTAAHPATADAVGAGIHIFDMVSGATLWRGGRDAGATRQFTDMTRAFPTQVRVLDMNGDSFADRMYAADISGQIWRFDIKANQTPADTVNGGVIARLGAEGLANPTAADTRRFYNTPDVSVFRDPITGTRVMSLAIGSGYRASPFDVTATDRFYSIRDKSVFGQLEQPAYDGYTVITEGDLVEVSGSVKKVVGSSDKGWKFTLPPNEKVVSNSITFKNEIIFVSLDPRSVSGAACGAGQGTNYRYRVSVINGDPIVNNLDSITPGLEDEARRERLPQGGILPPPTVIFPSPDANCTGPACNPPPLVCIGVLCDDPYPSRPPKRTLWTEDGIE